MPSPKPHESAGAPSARQRILLTAHDLFYRDGVRATGIDRIIAESGVAKLTFYRHFPAKNELILAFLEYRHELWMSWFVDALGRHGASEGAGFTPLLKTIEEWLYNPLFRGCAFINAVAELGGTQPEVLRISQRHKQEMQEVISGLLTGSHAAAKGAAAALAVDGAIVCAQMAGPAAGKASENAQKKSALDGLRQVLMALERASEKTGRPARQLE